MENGTRQVVDMGNMQQNTTWVISGLDSTTTYYYSVQTIDNSKLASEFASEKLFVYEQSSIEEIETGINVYPNPTNGLLKIELNENNRIVMLKVTTISGMELISRSVNENIFFLDLSSYPGGVYLIRTFSNGGVSTMRVIKY
jgi:hypothetical protein